MKAFKPIKIKGFIRKRPIKKEHLNKQRPKIIKCY
jgi:hypothetical protein